MNLISACMCSLHIFNVLAKTTISISFALYLIRILYSLLTTFIHSEPKADRNRSCFFFVFFSIANVCEFFLVWSFLLFNSIETECEFIFVCLWIFNSCVIYTLCVCMWFRKIGFLRNVCLGMLMEFYQRCLSLRLMFYLFIWLPCCLVLCSTMNWMLQM